MNDGVESPLHAESEIEKSTETVILPPKSTSDLPPNPVDVAAIDTQRPTKTRIIRRDSNGKLRFYDAEGNEYQDPDFERKQQAVREAMEMEDLTQKSSMSLTQENPPSAYDQFDIQRAIRDEYPSTATPDEDRDAHAALRTQHDSLHSRQHASTRTESTAHTYEENDPRYIKLDFDPAPIDEDAEEDENVSRDASFAAPQIELQNGHSYEPQTPAPLNPFNRKGSVLKASQMFGATQPSSIGRLRTSPTSSRPSPDIYNDFSSPPKRQRIASSPLAARAEVDDTSPLQSSVRHILARSMSTELPPATIPRTSGVQSFDAGPRIQRPAIEPRPYLSMEESQERRSRGIENESDTDSDGSNSSIEARPRKRKMEREQLIRQELSTVGRIPSSSGRPASTTSTTSAASAVVEVPSTGRRRSWQEDYVAQCEGFDARDTQQDDIVADSQANPDQDEASELPVGNPSTSALRSNPPDLLPRDQLVHSRDPPEQTTDHEPNIATVSVSSQPLNPQTEHHSELHEAINTSEATTNALPEPSLPLQELSSNRSNLRTPMANKNQLFSDGSETVPETSPPEERLRPMGEIASISFGADGDDDMASNPGFTQDVDFDNAMRMRSSPQPPPRATTTRNDSAPTLEAMAAGPSILSKVEAAPLHQPPFAGPENLDLMDSANPEQLKDTAKASDIQGSDHSEPMLTNEPPPPPPAADAENEAPSKSSEETDNIARNDDPAPESTSTRSGLRSKNELKGPSRALRRTGSTSRSNTPPSRVSKQASAAKASGLRSAKPSSAPSSTISTPVGTPLPPLAAEEKANAPSSTISSGRNSAAVALANKTSTPAPLPGKRKSKRKSAVVVVDDDEPASATRSSKRHSTARSSKEDSADPSTLPGLSTVQLPRSNASGGLFENMAFAVSYIKREHERDNVTKLILDNGGQILQDGFEVLFEKPRPQELDAGLTLSATARPLGFSALIADDHSRKAKYMQALALGLPCISGLWVLACVGKGTILDWSPYLLSAGQSSFLGNAIKSRTLQPYPATDATLETTLQARAKLLNGKSVLVVMGKGKTEVNRKAYVFLARAIGPDRVGQVVDLSEARKKLMSSESEGQTWDLLYVDSLEEAAAATVFGSTKSSGGSRKRKRGPTAADDTTPSPKRIRIINDETMIQSLILGQLLED